LSTLDELFGMSPGAMHGACCPGSRSATANPRLVKNLPAKAQCPVACWTGVRPHDQRRGRAVPCNAVCLRWMLTRLVRCRGGV
jgi:hypothetical protein